MGQVIPGLRGRVRAAAAVGVVVLAVFAAGPATAANADVALQGNAFLPKTVTIKPGDTVVWTDKDVAPHSVTADDGSFDSHPDCDGPSTCMKLNDTYRYTFKNAGTFPYYCKIHGGKNGSGMAGVVVVSTTAATSTTLGPTTTTKAATTTTKKREAVASPPGRRTTTTHLPPVTPLPPTIGPTDTIAASVTDPLVSSTTTTVRAPNEQGAVVIREEAGEGKDRNVPLLLVAGGALAAATAGALTMWRRGRLTP